jgi:hypothetical protein
MASHRTTGKAILAANAKSADGYYFVKPPGTDGNNKRHTFKVYCDMTSWDGGWTLLMQGMGQDISNWRHGNDAKFQDGADEYDGPMGKEKVL